MSDPLPVPRSATVVRRTRETSITLKLHLSGGTSPHPRSAAAADAGAGVCTGHAFLDHLLAALAKHAGFALAVEACGDQAGTGPHHLAEDVGLAFGEALRFSLYGTERVPAGECAPGVGRFGHAVVPMDDALVKATIDLSGRPGAYLGGLASARGPCGAGLAGADWAEFCRALSAAGLLTLHLEVVRGEDPHHVLEAAAKAIGRALGEACRPAADPGAGTSTKGRVHLEVSMWSR